MQVTSKMLVLIIVGVLLSTSIYGQDCQLGTIYNPESCEVSTDRSRIQITASLPNYNHNVFNSTCLLKMSIVGNFSDIDSAPRMDYLVDHFSFEDEFDTEAQINFVSAFGYLIFDLGRHQAYIFGINITTFDGRTFEEIIRSHYEGELSTTPRFLIEPLPCAYQ